MNNKALELLTLMKKNGNNYITKVIPFTNDDVPKFLKKLDKFEKESRKHHLIIK